MNTAGEGGTIKELAENMLERHKTESVRFKWSKFPLIDIKRMADEILHPTIKPLVFEADPSDMINPTGTRHLSWHSNAAGFLFEVFTSTVHKDKMSASVNIIKGQYRQIKMLGTFDSYHEAIDACNSFFADEIRKFLG